MLNDLIESKNHTRENRKVGKYLAITLFVVLTLCLNGILWSLFAKELGMNFAGSELSNIVTPIPVTKDEPEPEPEPEKPIDKRAASSSQIQVTIRQSNMARVDETQFAPDKISVTPNTQRARPNTDFKVIPNAVERDAVSTSPVRNSTANNNDFLSDSEPQKIVKESEKTSIPKPPAAPPKLEEKPKKTTVVSIGVVNGKATILPKPPYPQIARAVGAAGAVNVQVMIDEEGNVISARAVSGHPTLRDAAERAAKSAKFTPTLLSNVPVKVNGLIVYNFTK